VLRYIQKVTEKDSYWWVECAGCSGCWQVPFFAEERLAASWVDLVRAPLRPFGPRS